MRKSAKKPLGAKQAGGLNQGHFVACVAKVKLKRPSGSSVRRCLRAGVSAVPFVCGVCYVRSVWGRRVFCVSCGLYI